MGTPCKTCPDGQVVPGVAAVFRIAIDSAAWCTGPTNEAPNARIAAYPPDALSLTWISLSKGHRPLWKTARRSREINSIRSHRKVESMQQPQSIMQQHWTRHTLPTPFAHRAKNPVNTTRTCNKLLDVYM